MQATDSDRIPIDSDYDARTEDSISEYALASVTTGFRFENGRTYHAYRDGQYWGPNDAKMLNHENIIHHLCLLTLRDRLFLAPVQNPRRVLDIGTGSGLWAIDVADKFPSAKVIGIDLSQVPSVPHPDNVEFVVDDATSMWTYNDNFDFIHIRGLFGSIADWPALYTEIFNHLHPGGWFEQLDWSLHLKSDDGTLLEDSMLAQWSRDAITLCEQNGKTGEIAERMGGLLHDAGFVDVTEKKYKWPIGTWSSDPATKKIGHWNLRQNWEEGLEGWAMALYTRIWGWSAEQVHERCRQVRASIRNRRQHAYHEIRVVYGRKPD